MALAPSFDLVAGAIELDHGAVDADLVAGIVADERRGDLRLHVGDRLLRALAAVAGLVAVAEFDGLVFAGRGAGGNGGAAEGAGGEADVDLDGRIAAGIDDFAGGDGGDGGVHGK